MRGWIISAVSSLALAAACQSAHGLQPAKIISADIKQLNAELAQIVGRANVAIVPGDPVGASTLAVPPPRLSTFETRSPALPRQFKIMVDRGACYLMEEGSEETYEIQALTCERNTG